jgi:hypothetical protein
MNGFSKDLEPTRMNGKLYHSCTLEGINNLIQNFRPEDPVCTSTKNSARLFGRVCVVVFEDRQWVGDYTPFDSDAGKNMGWDEFRVRFRSVEDMINSIESIIMPAGFIQHWEKNIEESTDEDDNEDHYSSDVAFFRLIEEWGIPYPEESDDEFYNF